MKTKILTSLILAFTGLLTGVIASIALLQNQEGIQVLQTVGIDLEENKTQKELNEYITKNSLSIINETNINKLTNQELLTMFFKEIIPNTSYKQINTVNGINTITYNNIPGTEVSNYFKTTFNKEITNENIIVEENTIVTFNQLTNEYTINIELPNNELIYFNNINYKKENNKYILDYVRVLKNEENYIGINLSTEFINKVKENYKLLNEQDFNNILINQYEKELDPNFENTNKIRYIFEKQSNNYILVETQIIK